MNSYILILLIVLYFIISFAFAYFVEKRKPKWVSQYWIYALSIGVYCTAWTYYGSIGVASTSGINFLTIYLGPLIAIPLWILVLRKIHRISKSQKVSSIADFISIRYGGNRFLGALVTFTCLLAIIPYISLQLKALSETFDILTIDTESSKSLTETYTFYIAILLALFAAFFGTRNLDASENRRGLITTIAIESLLKLIFFLVVSVWVIFCLFNGTFDIFNQMEQKVPNFTSLYTFNSTDSAMNWILMICLSFFSIFLLPRQFHVSVVELRHEKLIKKAIWIFPLFLLLFNLPVVYLAWAGILEFGTTVNSDYYSILLPLNNNQLGIAILVFFGGFFSIISMIIVSSLALSIMLTNNVLMPYGLFKLFKTDAPEYNSLYVKNIRRISIFSIIIISYLFYISFSVELNLFSIGLISFLIVSQLGPSFFIGLYWNRGTSKGAIFGTLAGLIIVFLSTLYPFIKNILLDDSVNLRSVYTNFILFKSNGLPNTDILAPIPNAFYWSILFNTIVYLVVSTYHTANYRERNYAELFVKHNYYANLHDNALVWKGEAYVKDIKNLLRQFLEKNRTQRALDLFYKKYDVPNEAVLADARLINFSEKLLSGSIGASSAKILMGRVVKEKPISLVELLTILDENKEALNLNKKLKEKSKQLTKLTKNLHELNHQLLAKDKQKDNFLDTVAHELKTPITSIKMSAEILQEDLKDMSEEDLNQFLDNILKETDRIARLINNLLNIENFEKGSKVLNQQNHFLLETLEKVLNAFEPVIKNKKIEVEKRVSDKILWRYDEDKIIQVLHNLISNAIKFIPKEKGKIIVEATQSPNLEIRISDNGIGIPVEDQSFIFDKFYQSRLQNTQKPIGSGLGLSISKSIIESHKAKISYNKEYKQGAQFIIIFNPIS